MASAPLLAVATRYPSPARTRLSISRVTMLSSTSKTRLPGWLTAPMDTPPVVRDGFPAVKGGKPRAAGPRAGGRGASAAGRAVPGAQPFEGPAQGGDGSVQGVQGRARVREVPCLTHDPQ